jgi:hypothetical protein
LRPRTPNSAVSQHGSSMNWRAGGASANAIDRQDSPRPALEPPRLFQPASLNAPMDSGRPQATRSPVNPLRQSHLASAEVAKRVVPAASWTTSTGTSAPTSTASLRRNPLR